MRSLATRDSILVHRQGIARAQPSEDVGLEVVRPLGALLDGKNERVGCLPRPQFLPRYGPLHLPPWMGDPVRASGPASP